MESEDRVEEAACKVAGCFLWLFLAVCCCSSYFLGKHVGRTELTNEMLIQQIHSERPLVPEIKKETE